MKKIYGELGQALRSSSMSTGTLFLMNPGAGILSMAADAGIAYETEAMGRWFQDLGLRDILFDRQTSESWTRIFDYMDEKDPDAIKKKFGSAAGFLGIETQFSGGGEYFTSVFGSIQRLFLLDIKKDSHNRNGNLLIEVSETENLEELKKELLILLLERSGLFELTTEVSRKFFDRKKQYVEDLMESIEEANRIGSEIIAAADPFEFLEKVEPLVKASKNENTKKLDIRGFVKQTMQEFQKLKSDKKKYNEILAKIGAQEKSDIKENIAKPSSETEMKVLKYVYNIARSDFANVISESMLSTYEEMKEIITGNIDDKKRKSIEETDIGKKYIEWMEKSMKKLDQSLTKSKSLQK
tara:strand:- start:5184 stop:6245 length:1062 start_codon:yes stop_codon:yes gene_type:complete